ncbi:unnamed protein product [Ophioblennius macclurei]
MAGLYIMNGTNGEVNHMVVCFCLDAVLLLYCVVFTVFFFREKYKNFMSSPKSADVVDDENDDGTYQELERPKDADPYQVLQPAKKKKKARRSKEAEGQKKKPLSAAAASAPP